MEKISPSGGIYTSSIFQSTAWWRNYTVTLKAQFSGDNASGTLRLDTGLGNIVLRRVANSAGAEAQRLAAEEEAQRLAEAEAQRLASEEIVTATLVVPSSGVFDGVWEGEFTNEFVPQGAPIQATVENNELLIDFVIVTSFGRISSKIVGKISESGEVYVSSPLQAMGYWRNKVVILKAQFAGDQASGKLKISYGGFGKLVLRRVADP